MHRLQVTLLALTAAGPDLNAALEFQTSISCKFRFNLHRLFLDLCNMCSSLLVCGCFFVLHLGLSNRASTGWMVPLEHEFVVPLIVLVEGDHSLFVLQSLLECNLLCKSGSIGGSRTQPL